MTRVGKCDICRQRKVKCDERRPKCGQCMKKNRPCLYNYGKVSKFIDESSVSDGVRCFAIYVDSDDCDSDLDIERASSGSPIPGLSSGQTTILSVRSAKGAKLGRGTFHTLTPIRLNKAGVTSAADIENIAPSRRSPHQHDVPEAPNLLHTPSCPDNQLRARFIEIMGTKPVEWNPTFLWGSWVAEIPLRIGTNKALDDATACFIAGSVVHANQTQYNLSAARTQYSRALISLQGALTADDDRRLATETLAAVKLLTAFEAFMGMKTNRYISHIRGLTKLLVARGPHRTGDNMERSLFYSSLPYEFTDAVLNGTDSAFDSPEWLFFPPPEYVAECPLYETACKAVMQQIIRLPRLMRLVRELRQDPLNIDLGIEALQLAEKLYLSNLDFIINGALYELVDLVPTVYPEISEHVPESIWYSSINIFETLTRYCYCRVLIFGLCQTLCEVFPFSTVFDPVTMAEEDMKMAEYIVMSVQYAEQMVDPMPLGPLLIALPLQLSFGAWWRCERSEEDISPQLREKGRVLKIWSMEKSNEFLRIWAGQEMTTLRLEVETTACEGGPLMPWMAKRVENDVAF